MLEYGLRASLSSFKDTPRGGARVRPEGFAGPVRGGTGSALPEGSAEADFVSLDAAAPCATPASLGPALAAPVRSHPGGKDSGRASHVSLAHPSEVLVQSAGEASAILFTTTPPLRYGLCSSP